MSINVAKLFATMGFNIDTTDVHKVNNVIQSVKTSSNDLSRKLFVMNNHLQKSQGYLSKIAKVDGSGKAVGNVGTRYVNLASSVDKAREKIGKFGRLLTTVDPRLETTGNKLTTLTSKWKDLNDVITKANASLSQVSTRVPRSPTQTSVGIRNGVYVGSTQSSYSGKSNYTSKDKSFMQQALGGIPLMLNPFTPSGLLAGGAITGGVALKETVSAGRERIKSENVMLMAAKDQEQYAESLKFVREESYRLGQDTTEMGMAFGKVLQSAKGKMDFKEVQNTFTSFGEMMVAMGSDVEDQKGVYRALTQMLSKGKIEAEEEGQMAERGLPAKELVKRAAMATYKVDEDAYQSMRQKGQVKFEDIAPELNKMLREMANNNDALQKHLNTSMTAQARFMNTLKDGAEALMKAGLDDFLKMMFNGLTTILPHLLTFTKGVIGAVKGVVSLSKSISTFVSENPKSLFAISALSTAIALFASRTGFATLTFARFGLGVTGALSAIGKAMRRILPLFVLMTVFQSYSDYMDGKDNWMAKFVNWLDIMFLEFELFVAKLKLAFIDIKNLEMPKWRVDIDVNGAAMENALIPEQGTIAGDTFRLGKAISQGSRALFNKMLMPSQPTEKPMFVPQSLWDSTNPVQQNNGKNNAKLEGSVRVVIQNGNSITETNIPVGTKTDRVIHIDTGGMGILT